MPAPEAADHFALEPRQPRHPLQPGEPDDDNVDQEEVAQLRQNGRRQAARSVPQHASLWVGRWVVCALRRRSRTSRVTPCSTPSARPSKRPLCSEVAVAIPVCCVGISIGCSRRSRSTSAASGGYPACLRGRGRGGRRPHRAWLVNLGAGWPILTRTVDPRELVGLAPGVAADRQRGQRVGEEEPQPEPIPAPNRPRS